VSTIVCLLCSISCGLCIVCSSNYSFWLPLWYLKSFSHSKYLIMWWLPDLLTATVNWPVKSLTLPTLDVGVGYQGDVSSVNLLSEVDDFQQPVHPDPLIWSTAVSNGIVMKITKHSWKHFKHIQQELTNKKWKQHKTNK